MSEVEQSFISVASYNVLCDAYIKPEYYPRCDPSAFRPERRNPLLLERVAGLGTDIICLQEVDAEMFERLQNRLALDGYVGHWSQKSGGRPDGCATFLRGGLEALGWLAVPYKDGHEGRPASGCIAQQALLVTPQGHALMIVNTHLKWDAPETPLNERYGLAQARELSEGRAPSFPVIICGDFNAEYDSETMKVLASTGYEDSHLGVMAPTCIPNGVSRKIDAILCNDSLQVIDFGTPPIDNNTPLPSATEPSDHVPVFATLVTAGY